MVIPVIPPNGHFLFEAPTPFMIGVNRHEQYFWEKNLDQSSQSIFVFLDLHIIYINAANSELISFPKLDFIIRDLNDKLYPFKSEFSIVTNEKILAEKITSWKADIQESLKKKKSQQFMRGLTLETYSTKEEADSTNIKIIFEHFRTELIKNVVCFLPQLSPLISKQLTDEEFHKEIDLIIHNENLREFFYVFHTTQVFSSYPYCVSQHYKSVKNMNTE